jgi:hypothetical protein
MTVGFVPIGPNLTEGPAATWDSRRSIKEEELLSRSFCEDVIIPQAHPATSEIVVGKRVFSKKKKIF